MHRYLVRIGFEKTNDNSNLYIKEGSQDKILLVEIFLDDIIFKGHEMLCKSFVEEVRKEFEMSMFGEIKFFIGLIFHQMKDGICIT